MKQPQRHVSSPRSRAGDLMLRLGGSDRAKRLVTASPGAREVAGRFVAAESPEAACALVAGNRDKGLLASLEVLAPVATDREQASLATRRVTALLQLLGDECLGPGAEVSLRLSALGQALPRDGARASLQNAAAVCQAAQQVGGHVTLEMEDHTTTDATLDCFTDLARDFPLLGVTVQAQLRRSLDDCRRLAAGQARVRLCKGGHSEPVQVAWAERGEVDENFGLCLEELMAGNGYPMVATHDPALVSLAQDLAERHVRGREGYEFQMYHGVRPWEQRRLVDTGHQVRVLLPVGEDWYGYLARRVAERPANVAPLLRALVTRR